MDLTPKRKRFIEEYLVDLNPKNAAIRAGYAEAGAKVEGYRLLRDATILAAIEKAQKARAARTGITADRVLNELAKLGFSDIRKAVQWRSNVTEVGEDPDTGEPQLKAFNEVQIVDSAQLDDETAAAISEVSQTKDGALKIKLYDKRAALVDIGRHLGMFGSAKRVEADRDDVAPSNEPQTDSWDRLLN